MSHNAEEKVIVNLTKTHLIASVVMLLVGVVVWPTVFYVRVNAAMQRFEDADRNHDAKFVQVDERLVQMDKAGSLNSSAKIEANRVALVQNINAMADHEARIRVMEKTINDMAADLRWLVAQQRAKSTP